MPQADAPFGYDRQVRICHVAIVCLLTVMFSGMLDVLASDLDPAGQSFQFVAQRMRRTCHSIPAITGTLLAQSPT